MSQPHCSTMGFSQCCLEGRKEKGMGGGGGEREETGGEKAEHRKEKNGKVLLVQSVIIPI